MHKLWSLFGLVNERERCEDRFRVRFTALTAVKLTPKTTDKPVEDIPSI